MLTQSESEQLVGLIDKLEWPVPPNVFFALASKTILPSVDLALVRRGFWLKRPKILLTRRPASDPYFAGLWHIPGGIIIPGETALSTIEKRVLKPDVGITLSREPEFVMGRDILMGPPGSNTSPRGQEAYRLFQYVLRYRDPAVPVDETKKFYRLDEIPDAFVEHQRPSIEKLCALHGM